jgi:tetratricopeptide (TPR) repeat protein
MHGERKTAIVQIELLSGATEGSLPLATERAFGVILLVDGVSYPSQSFSSPINDEQWRLFLEKLRDCNKNRSPAGTRDAVGIRALAHQLYTSLAGLNPVMRDFLGLAGTPRRLVIQTTRPELHLLPWAALVDDNGAFLADGDLSVVQSWSGFTGVPVTTADKLKLVSVVGPGTNQVTQPVLASLPKEILQEDGSYAFQNQTPQPGRDILHLEAHGDAVTNQTGAMYAATLGANYGDVKLALLWSCSSGSANSWGESPALNLHRSGAKVVLSFLAELHNQDAASIAQGFYNEVFGPAASRDPETALVRMRCVKFKTEFAYANWASMTVYMRSPLDLSALPLNGPRVPAGMWSDDPLPTAVEAAPAEKAAESSGSSAALDAALTPGAAVDAISALEDQDNQIETDLTEATASDLTLAEPVTATAGTQTAETATAAAAQTTVVDTAGLWKRLATAVSKLQPGTVNEFPGVGVDNAAAFNDAAVPPVDKLPEWVFKPWRGNVIRIDGGVKPLSDEAIAELNVDRKGFPPGESAEKLVWFFNQIAHYGSPLIVWTNARHRHLHYLKTIAPSSNLTFLLMYGPPQPATIQELVDANRLEEAKTAAMALPPGSSDEELSAAYFACMRLEKPDLAMEFIKRIHEDQGDKGELTLLIANYISRQHTIPNPRPDWLLQHPDGKLSSLLQQHVQEDCYRRVIADPDSTLREVGRAKHELGYLLQGMGKTGVAEMLYAQALADLEATPQEIHDSRWHTAIGNLMRDWADLLSRRPDQLDRAQELLRRAMAIHSFHGRELQIAYTLDTAARIALTGQRYNEAIEHAMETANQFEKFENWRGWGEAMKVLFDCLGETRDTARMLSVADLALSKLHHSNLPEAKRARLRLAFTFQKAKANWICGDLKAAHQQLEELGCGNGDGGLGTEIDPEFELEVQRLWKFLATRTAK